MKVNHIVKIGDGMHASIGSDCYPYVVAAIKGKSIYLARASSKLVGGSCQSEHQEYEFSIPPLNSTPLANCERAIFHGTYYKGAGKYGKRFYKGFAAYRDPCF